MTASKLFSAASCTLRPDRLARFLTHGFREDVCFKQRMQAAIGVYFERLCVWPQNLNRCFDWDVAGTRWARDGLSLTESYAALGLRSWASTKEVKAAYHRAALANHPDKV